MQDPETSEKTSLQLLARLHDWNDQAGWEEFNRLYRGFILRKALGAGLPPEDAEEVVQDVIHEVAEKIQLFQIDEGMGRFRGWLSNLAWWRIKDRLRRIGRGRSRVPVNPDEDLENVDPTQALTSDGGFGHLEESQWKEHIMEIALDRLKRESDARKYQAFVLYKYQGANAANVARDMKFTEAQLYLIAHRMTLRLSELVKHYRQRLG